MPGNAGFCPSRSTTAACIAKRDRVELQKGRKQGFKALNRFSAFWYKSSRWKVGWPGQSHHFWYASRMRIHEQDAVCGTPAVAIMEHFSAIDDPRRDHGKRHVLEQILVLTICAVICGADSFVAVEAFGKAKLDFLRRFLTLPNGIPSHDTIGAVFARIAPSQFEQCFLGWVNALFERTAGRVVAIDGKTLRRSYHRKSKKAALQMVSAWAASNRLVLGQVAVDEHSNEITAIPHLLEVLDLNGCIVTIDAIGCQQDIAAQIIDQGGDYVLTGYPGGVKRIRAACSRKCISILLTLRLTVCGSMRLRSTGTAGRKRAGTG